MYLKKPMRAGKGAGAGAWDSKGATRKVTQGGRENVRLDRTMGHMKGVNLRLDETKGQTKG